MQHTLGNNSCNLSLLSEAVVVLSSLISLATPQLSVFKGRVSCWSKRMTCFQEAASCCKAEFRNRAETMPACLPARSTTKHSQACGIQSFQKTFSWFSDLSLAKCRCLRHEHMYMQPSCTHGHYRRSGENAMLCGTKRSAQPANSRITRLLAEPYWGGCASSRFCNEFWGSISPPDVIAQTTTSCI